MFKVFINLVIFLTLLKSLWVYPKEKDPQLCIHTDNFVSVLWFERTQKRFLLHLRQFFK